MSKRRRVDLSLRLEEAKSAERALTHWLDRNAGVHYGYKDPLIQRAQRVLKKLQQGIKYVVEVNPTRRPSGAKAGHV